MILQNFLTAAVPRVRAVNDLAVSLSNWDGIKNLQEEHRSLMRRCLSAFAGNYVFCFFLSILQLWKVFSDSRHVIRILNRLDKCPPERERFLLPDCDGLLHGDVLAELNLAVVLSTHKICPFLLDVEGNHSTFSYFFHFGHPQRLKAWPQILSVGASVAWSRNVMGMRSQILLQSCRQNFSKCPPSDWGIAFRVK